MQLYSLTLFTLGINLYFSLYDFAFFPLRNYATPQNPMVPIPGRPQAWFSHPMPSSVPSVRHIGITAPPLFPIQNVHNSLPVSTPAMVTPQNIAPPGLPSSTNIPVSQPLFPIGSVGISERSLAARVNESISPAELKSTTESTVVSNDITNFHCQVSQGSSSIANSHMYASGPNTAGPSIGPPPVVSNKVPPSQACPNEVYLIWDDDATSMEERRLSLPQYQVHDETTQMCSVDAAIDKRISEGRLAGRMSF